MQSSSSYREGCRVRPSASARPRAGVLVAPVVEETTYRGLGFDAVRSSFGPLAAALVTGVAFGLSHGLLLALPVLALFGVILGLLRWRTESLYPPIVLHALFNGAALLAAVTIA